MVLERVLQFRHAVEHGFVAVRHRIGHVVIIDQKLRQFAQPLRDRIEHARAGFELRLLRHIGQLHAGLAPERAVVERGVAGENLQQAGFAGAVAPDQRKPLAGFDHQRGVVEQRHVAESKAGVIEGDQWHGEHGKWSGAAVYRRTAASRSPGYNRGRRLHS